MFLTNLFVALAVVLLALGSIWLLHHALVERSVNNLIGQAERIASGDLNTPTPRIVKLNEIERLSAAMEAMRKSLLSREDELKQSLDYTKKLVDNAPVSIAFTERDAITYANPTMTKMLGFEDEQDLIGKHALDFVAPEYREILLQRRQDRLEGKAVAQSYEIKLLKQNGESFDAVLQPRVIDWSHTSGMLLFVSDVSESVALRDQLQQSQKMEAIGTLAGGIAHDFNNILFAITGYVELALDDVPPEARVRQYLEQVLKAARRAGDMTRQILAFSRKKESEELAPLSLAPVVKEALKFLRGSVPTTIDIRSDIDSTVGKIRGDVSQIHQVLMNLCTNAVYAMGSAKGILHVELSQTQIDNDFAALHPLLKPGEYAKLSVSDSGGGMPPEVVKRIFEPYYTTKPLGEGTGLGLAVVHGIVERHGGAITVKTQPGEGTVLDVYFPTIPEQSVAEEKTADTTLPTGSGNVLVVDDEISLRTILDLTLTSLGYSSTVCEDGLAALEAFKSAPEKFRLVLSDLQMPRMTGLELAQAVHAMRPDIPIILVTGSADPVAADAFHKFGIAAVMRKPVAKADLARTIHDVIN